MKSIIFTFFLSIFWMLNICNAQNTEGTLSICFFAEKKIPMAEIARFTTDDCKRVIYTDTEGNELQITEYVFAISPADGGNAYFEQVNGDMITPTLKERLAKVTPGDKIVIANIKCIKTNGTTALLNGKDFIVAE